MGSQGGGDDRIAASTDVGMIRCWGVWRGVNAGWVTCDAKHARGGQATRTPIPSPSAASVAGRGAVAWQASHGRSCWRRSQRPCLRRRASAPVETSRARKDWESRLLPVSISLQLLRRFALTNGDRESCRTPLTQIEPWAYIYTGRVRDERVRGKEDGRARLLRCLSSNRHPPPGGRARRARPAARPRGFSATLSFPSTGV
jgi:hypothetical protein